MINEGNIAAIVEGNYIETVSGKRIAIPDTDPSQIDIFDIAHALSYAARFAGHTKVFYSVAEHSINVARLVPDRYKLQALLHDATEAYLCDIPTPFKAMMPEYKNMEAHLWRAISARFGVAYDLHPSVKKADATMLMTERDALKPIHGDWGEREFIKRVQFKKIPNKDVKDQFLIDYATYLRIP